jgi:hypothetical protein
MILSEDERLELARAALKNAMNRFDLVVAGDNTVSKMKNEATIVPALVEFIEAKQRHCNGE